MVVTKRSDPNNLRGMNYFVSRFHKISVHCVAGMAEPEAHGVMGLFGRDCPHHQVTGDRVWQEPRAHPCGSISVSQAPFPEVSRASPNRVTS